MPNPSTDVAVIMGLASRGERLTRRQRRILRTRGMTPQHCKRKTRHATKVSADAAALMLGYRFRAIACPFCKGWHVNSGGPRDDN